jgi:hypothetical protein
MTKGENFPKSKQNCVKDGLLKHNYLGGGFSHLGGANLFEEQVQT